MPYPQAFQDKARLKPVDYMGTDILQPGYALCYDRSAGTLATVVDPKRFMQVNKPASGNLHNFAGVVHAGFTPRQGPCRVDIVEPTGHCFEPHTDQSCVQERTLLTVKPASYALGGIGQGLIVGEALQTVNRASVPGVVQALLHPVNRADLIYGVTVPTNAIRTASPAIWETCPWHQLATGRVNGFVYFNDFIGNYVLATNQACTHLGHDTTGYTGADASSVISMTSTAPHGVVALNSAVDNEDAILCCCGGLNTGGAFEFSADTKLWMEVRSKTLNTTVSKYNVFIGFAEEALNSAGALILNTDAMADKDYVGFQRPFADGLHYDTVHNIAVGGHTQVADAAVDVVANVYNHLGIYCDGTTVYFYNNGVVLDDSVLVAAANFPIDQKMAFYVGLMLGHSTAASQKIDWVRIAQMRG